MTDNTISRSAPSEFSIKLIGKENESGDDCDVISNCFRPYWYQFHITIIEQSPSAFFSINSLTTIATMILLEIIESDVLISRV